MKLTFNVQQPQRPLRATRVLPDQENTALALSKQTLHQRHKSTGTLSTIMQIGGLKAAAKRTVFGDVSNTVRNPPSAYDDSAIPSKQIHEIVKPVTTQDKAPAFLRPAQRPLNSAASKISLTNTSTTSSEPIPNSIAPRPAPADPRQQVPAIKRTLSKRSTSIYKDADADAEAIQSHQITNSQAVRPGSAPIAPVHQILDPREHNSHPQSNHDQPPLRRTESKLLGTNYLEPTENTSHTDAIYEDAPEELAVGTTDAAYEAYISAADDEKEQDLEPAKSTQDMIDRQNRQLPAAPLVSEPEEYWDEEEEIYDEQGYTTAHSYRSRGDNTTGGATTVLFPKVTKKVEREIAAAKDLVERSRTQDEIDDEQWDTSMVAEYGDEIFAYMRELEVSSCISFSVPERVPGDLSCDQRRGLSCSLCLPQPPAMFTSCRTNANQSFVLEQDAP
jgi:G2/mitotic-specific cyclin 3/4